MLKLLQPRWLLLWLAVWLAAALAGAGLWSARSGLGWADTLLVAMPAALSAGLLLPSAWAITRVVPIGTGGQFARGLLRHAGTAVVVGGAWAALWCGLAVLLGLVRVEPVLSALLTWEALSSGAMAWAIASLTYGLALLLGEVLQSQARAEQEREAALRAQHHAVQSQLQMLRAQVQPHFLFNCLHSISALSVLDPPAAQAMTLRLADYFRQTLAYSQRPWVSLADEWQHGQTFLSLEAIRMGEERLRWQFEASPQALQARVPALLLQPLLENAVKHGLWARADGGCIRVGAQVLDEWLRLTVSNPLSPHRDDGARPGTGTGLRNLRERLVATYGPQALLETVQSLAGEDSPGEQHFTVALTIPLTSIEPSTAEPS
jgi:hypothetical protein